MKSCIENISILKLINHQRVERHHKQQMYENILLNYLKALTRSRNATHNNQLVELIAIFSAFIIQFFLVKVYNERCNKRQEHI